MIDYIDSLLNRITMYKLLLYYLIGLLLAAIGLSATGVLHFGVSSIIVSTLIIVISCWIINKIFAEIFHAPTNTESVYITALILALIIAPMTSHTILNITFLLAASGLAMASKYILTIRKKHIFNPAAIAVALTALGPKQSADWWVGTTALLPFVLIGGLLLVRKIRRGRMVLTFFITSLLATVLYTLLTKGSIGTSLHDTLFTSSMFFLGFVMLTEPLTTPPTSGKQSWYAGLVGLLFPPQFHIFSLYSTPELALIAGNIFSYIISPKTKLFPTLKQKLKISSDTIDFIFNPNQKFAYTAGQYVELTLPHKKTDNRGDRRYFTLASSPTEKDIRLGVKFYKGGSSYKKALLAIDDKTTVVAAQVSGDFVLPNDNKKKLVFIAGGIGITPFRSMIKFLIDTKQKRDITLLYSARTNDDFVYKDIFEQARGEIGLNTIYFVTDEEIKGDSKYIRHQFIDDGAIRSEVADYKQSYFYISGTQAMVKVLQETLSNLGVPRHQIKVDYFPGYS